MLSFINPIPIFFNPLFIFPRSRKLSCRPHYVTFFSPLISYNPLSPSLLMFTHINTIFSCHQEFVLTSPISLALNNPLHCLVTPSFSSCTIWSLSTKISTSSDRVYYSLIYDAILLFPIFPMDFPISPSTISVVHHFWLSILSHTILLYLLELKFFSMHASTTLSFIHNIPTFSCLSNPYLHTLLLCHHYQIQLFSYAFPQFPFAPSLFALPILYQCFTLFF